jgi:hypothetical protein
MKQLLFTLLAFSSLSLSAQKDKWKQVQGNGNIQKESRTVDNFTALDNHGSISVELTYGEKNAVTVEADENILPMITTTVKDGKLVIGSEGGGYSSQHKLKVYVTMNRITGLDLHGSGGITGNGAFYNEGTTVLDLHGSGKIKLGFASFTNLQAGIHGSGNIELTSGKVENLDASTNGSGTLDAYDITSNNVKAKTSGSGDVKVVAVKSLAAETNGSGSVHYKGDLTNVSIKKNGSGTVVKH